MGDIELQVFADRLKELRNKLGLTQAQFVEELGITASALSAYEKNTKNPSIIVAKKIAEKYNVSLDWLCGLSDEKSKETKIMTYSDIINICNTYKNPSKLMDKFLSEMQKNLVEYLRESEHMCKLIKDGLIDNELYDLWLEKTIKKYDKPIVKEMPEVVDIFKDIEFENKDED